MAGLKVISHDAGAVYTVKHEEQWSCFLRSSCVPQQNQSITQSFIHLFKRALIHSVPFC